MDLEHIVSSLSLEELVGQTMCLYINTDKTNPEEFEEKIIKMRPGGIFMKGTSGDVVKKLTEIANRHLKVPIVVTSDIESGPHTPIVGGATIPLQMAVGACNDTELTEQAWEGVANHCRRNGFHWGFNPVVDLNYNFNNPECNVRSLSDNPDHVIKMAKSILKGFTKDGMMACTLKHFPGQGYDDRNSHFVTSENTLSKEEWFNTYGKVYKELFKQGVDSVMMGHVSLPAFQTEKDDLGYLPGAICESIINGLLKKQLGFEGVVISDALTMVGVAARYASDELPLMFLQAGGDMVLFPHYDGYLKIIEAVKNGKIGIERIKDAVIRILRLKERIHLFEKDYFKDLKEFKGLDEIALKIAQKSITKIRDFDNLLPVKLEKGSKILLVNVIKTFFPKELTGEDFLPLKKELESYGMSVTSIDNPDYLEVNKIKDEYDLIMINCPMSSDNFGGGSLRFNWEVIMTFWDGYVINHPRVIFTSFGDPYRIYDVPYMKTYLNAYSNFPETQKAVAKAVLGIESIVGKSPVEFKGFFEREV